MALSLTASLSLPSPSPRPSSPLTSSVWHACQTGDTSYLCLYLSSLSSSADLNLLNSFYETPLHVAAAHNQLACVLLLLPHRPLLDVADRESGWTALHRAVYRGHLSVACALIQAGADPTAVDLDGLTAFDLLRTRQSPAAFVAVDRSVWAEDEDGDDAQLLATLSAQQRRRRERREEEQSLAWRESTWRASLVHLLYAFGSNTNFALGLPSDSHHTKPRLIAGLAAEDVVGLACTRFVSFAVSNQGSVWGWGQGSAYRLGTGEERSEVVPRQLLMKTRVVEVDAEERWAAAVGEKGEVLVWGTVDFLRRGDDDDGAAPPSTASKSPSRTPPRKDDCVYPTPTRLESCRSLRVSHVCCSQSRLFLLSLAGELWYVGASLDDGAVTQIPRRVLSMMELTVSQVRCSRSSVVVLSRDGEVYQQVRGERKAFRVLFKFSAFSTFSTPHAASASSSPVQSSYSPPFSPTSPPFSPSTSGSPRAGSGRKRASAYPRVVKIAVSGSAERAIALTSHGEVYWWKILQEEVASNTSPPLPSMSHAYSIPPFYLTAAAPPLYSAAASSSSSSSSSSSAAAARGRRTAHLVQGLSSVRVVDVALGPTHTTVVTSLGDVYHWGNSPLLPCSAKPQRVHYLHQAARVWCSEQHVIVSTVYHKPRPPAPPSLSGAVPTLRALCEQRMAAGVTLSSLLPALSFAGSLSLPRMFSHALSYLLLNLNVLVHPAMKKLSLHEWAAIERHYHAGRVHPPPDDEADDDDHEEPGNQRLFMTPTTNIGLSHALTEPLTPVESDEKSLGFSLATADSDANSCSDASESEEGSPTSGQEVIPDLLALAQRARYSGARRAARKERRRVERLQAKERELAQRRREEEEQWRVGLSREEVVTKLRSQWRALKKKERRREERQAAGEGETDEKRDTWVRVERIKAELHHLANDGCAEAAQLLLDSDGNGRGEAAEAGQATPPAAFSSPASPRSASPPATPVSTITASASFDASLSRPVRLLHVDVDDTTQKGKKAKPQEPQPLEKKDEETKEGKPAETCAWGRSMVSSSPVPSASRSPPLSLFTMIQREQEQAAARVAPKVAAAAPARAATTPPGSAAVAALPRPLSMTSSPTSAAQRALSFSTANPWGAAAPPSAAAPSPTAAVAVTAGSCSPRPRSLADIQQEEASAQQRQKPSRPRPSSTTILPQPPLSTTPPSSAPVLAPFMLQLADYIPIPSVPPPAKSAGPARTWNVSRTTSPPSSSLRVIQAEESEHAGFALPSSAAKPATAAPSVVWGRADVARAANGLKAGGPVARVSDIQVEEERKREEERALRAVEELQLAEAAEAERKRAATRGARKARDRERRERLCALPSQSASEPSPPSTSADPPVHKSDDRPGNHIVPQGGAQSRGRARARGACRTAVRDRARTSASITANAPETRDDSRGGCAAHPVKSRWVKAGASRATESPHDLGEQVRMPQPPAQPSLVTSS